MSSHTLCQAGGGFRLSPQQARFWNLRTIHPGFEFGVQGIVRIKGNVMAERLYEAIKRVIGRYEILRTKFAALDGTSVPVQMVNATADVPFEMFDRRGKTHLLTSNCSGRLVPEQWSRMRNVSATTPLSFALELLPDLSFLVVSAAGLCADSHTLLHLVRQIEAAYSGSGPMEDPVIQYADFAEWQNQILESTRGDADPYWEGIQFQDLRFPRLPFERRRFESAGRSVDALSRDISSASVQAINAFAQRLGTPLTTVLLAAFQTALHRFSSQDRFLIGVTLDGRVQADLIGVMGPLAKSMPLSVQIDSNTELGRFIEQLEIDLTVAAYDQDRFDWQLPGEPTPGRPPGIFPVLFSSLDLSGNSERVSSSWDIASVNEQLEPYDLALTAEMKSESLRLHFKWNHSMFATADMELFAGSCAALLDEIAEDCGGRVCDYRMRAESDTAESLSAEPCADEKAFIAVHQLIEEQSRRVPDRTAVVCEGHQLSYEELNRRASILSRRIRETGAGPESVVAIVANRSPDFVIGIVAALKSGAAWLPIEPDVPFERIECMIEQSRAVAILTEMSLSRIVERATVPILHLDWHDDSGDAGSEKLAVQHAIDPKQLAYVIFTSGSTGQPKGVAIEHRQIWSYLEGFKTEQQLPDGAHYALVSTFAADLGLTPLLAALTSGGCLHVIQAARASDMEALADYFVRIQVDYVKIAPTHLEALCRAFPGTAKPSWRVLVIGGEPLTWELMAEVRKLVPDCVSFNEYGPTETCVGVVSGVADISAEVFQCAEVSIGRPRSGVSVHLLDRNLDPVPAWVSGELFIGGETVGRGYIFRSDLTAERFFPDPLGSVPGARMYRTGDLALRRSDGMVNFQRRCDRQVKVRGYRVELGEVEAALCRHPEVQSAFAAVIDDGASHKQLAAWAAIGSAKLTSRELTHFLELSLPRYMIPVHIVCVDQLKLTPNGKIDQRALVTTHLKRSSACVHGPVDEIEENLLAVWTRVLGLEDVNVEDNYFSLGGDSLRVIQLVHEARRYGISIVATDVLRYQTIRKLRAAMQTNFHQELFPDGVPVLATPGGIKNELPADIVDSYPATAMQSFVLEKYAQNKGSQGVFHIQDCFRIQDRGFSISALEAAFRAVIERHPALRTVFHTEGARTMQWVRRSLNWKLRVEDISHLASDEQDAYVLQTLRNDRSTLFNALDESASLFRVAVLVRSGNDFNLIFSCHHAIMDGWGHRVLLNQLADAYGRIKAGAEVNLGAPDSACRELAVFLEQVRQSSRAAEFWRGYLAGLEMCEAEASQDPGAFSDGAVIQHELDPQIFSILVQLARESALSLHALLLSAWIEAIRRCSEQECMVTGIVVNGRTEHLTDPLSAVGLFWNIVPIVSRSRRPIIEQAAKIQKDLIDIQPYSGYPLSGIIAGHGAHGLFTSTFRYINFWNTRKSEETTELQVLGGQGHDLYPFPLNCSAALNSPETGGYLTLEYLPHLVSTDHAKAVFDEYIALLEQLTEATEHGIRGA